MSYDSANSQVRREVNAPNVAGASSATMAKFLFFQKTRIKKVHVSVVTAGTNTAAGADIYYGTNSIGAVTWGTGAADTVAHSGAIDYDLPANAVLEIKGKATSATGVVAITIEHVVSPDAVVS